MLDKVGESIEADTGGIKRNRKQAFRYQKLHNLFLLKLLIILLSLGLILLALALVMVYLRYRQARHLAGLGKAVFNWAYLKIGKKTLKPYSNRPIPIQTAAQRRHGLSGQWDVHVNRFNSPVT